jgi:hypothetical protein
MKIIKVKFPATSKLYETDFDYVDSYQGEYFDKKDEISAQDIGKAFFNSAPKWTAQLFELRNKIVAAFGLKIPEKVENRKELLDGFACEPNERLGLFKVYSKTENEVILGEDDKHLNFRVSLLKDDNTSKEGTKKLTISTTVKFNNWFGKLYFLPVKSFHQLIVPIMLKGVIAQIEK